MSWAWKPNPDVRRRVRAAAERGVDQGTRELFDASQQDVPEDTGRLRASGRVENDGLVGRIVYDEPYGVIVHENLTARHRNGRAKFLEHNMNTRREQVLDAVARPLRDDVF